MDTQHFLAELGAFAVQAEAAIVQHVKDVVFEVLADIVPETPFLTGGAMASWAASVGEPAYETAPDVTPATPLDAEEAQSRALTTIVRLEHLQLGQTAYISNGRPYISRLEDGYSQKSSHMVARALAKQDQRKTGG